MGDRETFMLRLQALIKDVPYEQHDEKFYQNAVYLVFTLAGAHAKVEDHTNIGRTDLEVTTGSYIYIFEFKYNRSAREALAPDPSARLRRAPRHERQEGVSDRSQLLVGCPRTG